VGLLCGIGRVLWMVGRSVVGGLWAQLLNIESREFVWSVVAAGVGLPLYLEISFSIYNVNFRIS
jgi:hypothetical protein